MEKDKIYITDEYKALAEKEDKTLADEAKLGFFTKLFEKAEEAEDEDTKEAA